MTTATPALNVCFKTWRYAVN